MREGSLSWKKRSNVDNCGFQRQSHNLILKPSANRISTLNFPIWSRHLHNHKRQLLKKMFKAVWLMTKAFYLVKSVLSFFPVFNEMMTPKYARECECQYPLMFYFSAGSFLYFSLSISLSEVMSFLPFKESYWTM